MPAKLVHCQFCRALLNPELKPSGAAVPDFFELAEIANVIEVPVAGYHILCPHCDQELRISKKYAGCAVACKFCSGQFTLDITSARIRTQAFYVGCPHCEQELRVAPKYVGRKVACKHCSGGVHIVSNFSSAKKK